MKPTKDGLYDPYAGNTFDVEQEGSVSSPSDDRAYGADKEPSLIERFAGISTPWTPNEVPAGRENEPAGRSADDKNEATSKERTSEPDGDAENRGVIEPPESGEPPLTGKQQVLSAVKAFLWFVVIFIIIIFAYKLVIGYMLRSTGESACVGAQLLSYMPGRLF